MIANEDAAWEVHQVLSDLSIPYAIIGGIAVQFWGEPRFTHDLDLTVLIPIEEQAETIQDLMSRLRPRRTDALEFALRNRIFLAQTSDGFPVDISLGLPGYEDEVVARAVDYAVGPGQAIRLCSPEDLIIHKAVARRPQDLRDLEGVIVRQGSKLEVDYVRRWLKVFSEWLETDEVIDCFEKPWRRFQSDD